MAALAARISPTRPRPARRTGGGAVIVSLYPVRMAGPPPPGPRRPERPLRRIVAGREQPSRVLIVEDQYLTAWHLETMVEDMGGEVCAAIASGEEAVTATVVQKPDLVLMDIHLAGTLDGIQAAEQIRLRSDAPIVFVTAFSDSGTIARARAVPASGIVGKPVAPDALRREIEALLA